MADAPERIRVAQDADGFWTCREAVSGSQEYVRADLYAALEAQLAEARKALDEDDYEEIISAAAINMRKAASGIRGQVITVQDSIDWWVMKETERRILSALEPSTPEGQQPVAEALELSGNTGELIDKMAEAIRGDTVSDETPWATLSEDRKIGWRGDAERALAVVKEYLTARRPSEQAVTEAMVKAAAKSAAQADYERRILSALSTTEQGETEAALPTHYCGSCGSTILSGQCDCTKMQRPIAIGDNTPPPETKSDGSADV